MKTSKLSEQATTSSTRVPDAGTRSFCSNTDRKMELSDADCQTLPPDDPSLPHHWYAMNVSYQRELRVQEELQRNDFETFIPMQTVVRNVVGDDSVSGPDYKQLTEPAIHNLIFIRSTYQRIRWMKMFNRTCSALQFLRTGDADKPAPERYILVAQMEQFIRASQTALGDERARFLTPEEARKNLNRPVCFVRGKYAGITGTLQRISHNKVVVLDLQGIVSLALPIGHVAEVEVME